MAGFFGGHWSFLDLLGKAHSFRVDLSFEISCDIVYYRGFWAFGAGRQGELNFFVKLQLVMLVAVRCKRSDNFEDDLSIDFFDF